MKFWDASAVVALVSRERGTELAEVWLKEDPVVSVWALTRLEVVSALERRSREEGWTSARRLRMLARAEDLSTKSHEVSDVIAVRSRALPLLGRYPLRAADAAQLGAALLVAESNVTAIDFVAFDLRLAEAARREGFNVLSWREET